MVKIGMGQWHVQDVVVREQERRWSDWAAELRRAEAALGALVSADPELGPLVVQVRGAVRREAAVRVAAAERVASALGEVRRDLAATEARVVSRFATGGAWADVLDRAQRGAR